MNRFVIIVLFFFNACSGQRNEKILPNQVSNEAPAVSKNCQQDTLRMDLPHSIIYWRGTKMRGAGKHEGEIHFQNGYLLTCDGQISGGSFTVDMKSMSVTDIPKTDPVPIKNLLTHLSNPDFFHTNIYSQASITISKIKIIDDQLLIDGNLTIKNFTKPITFTATRHGLDFETILIFNRHEWNIGYTGTWADRTLVDALVELEIKLRME